MSQSKRVQQAVSLVVLARSLTISLNGEVIDYVTLAEGAQGCRTLTGANPSKDHNGTFSSNAEQHLHSGKEIYRITRPWQKRIPPLVHC